MVGMSVQAAVAVVPGMMVPLPLTSLILVSVGGAMPKKLFAGCPCESRMFSVT